MTHRIGAKGQVVIPKHLRDRLGLHPGAEVEFELVDGHVAVSPRRVASALGGRFTNSGMAARLLAERSREPR